MTDSSVANARFQLLERPLVEPGKCSVCGTAERPVIDFGAYVQWYGAIYICESCLADAARTINMVYASELDEAREKASQSFLSQCAAYEVMVVSNEWYERASDLFGNIPVPDALSRFGIDLEDSGQSGEEVPSQPELPFDAESGDSDGTLGTPRQDSDSAIDSGPISISTDSSDEPESDELGAILNL